MEDSLLQHFDFGCTLFALPATHLDAVVLDFSPTAVDSLTLLPDDGTNPGRAKRCLLMSFLC